MDERVADPVLAVERDQEGGLGLFGCRHNGGVLLGGMVLGLPDLFPGWIGHNLWCKKRKEECVEDRELRCLG